MNVTKGAADEGAMTMAINIATANSLSIFTVFYGDIILVKCRNLYSSSNKFVSLAHLIKFHIVGD